MTDQPMVNLNITDIADAVRVIDHAAEQGAFRGWENIRQILALRDRLDQFVVAANAVTTPADQPPPPSDPVVVDLTNDVSPPHSRRQRRSRTESFGAAAH